MDVGLIISENIGKYADELRQKLRGKHILCCSCNVESLRCPVIAGDVSFVAWDSSVALSGIISLLHKISELYVDIPFFLLGTNNINDAQKKAIERLVQCKILDHFNLEEDLERFAEVVRSLSDVEEQKREIIKKIYKNILGTSQNMENLRLFISRVAHNHLPALLYGDAGCGKTIVARTIHETLCQKNEEASANFVTCDLQYLPKELMEEALCGTEHLSSGNMLAMDALIQKANGGTLFIKNIDRASLLLQTKLFEILEEEKRKTMNENKEKKQGFKLICSSLLPLASLVAEKKFREDLYYELTVQTFRIDTLKNRLEDIEVLARTYCEARNCTLHGSSLEKLLRHNWTGNVRELFSILDKALIYARKIGIVYPENIRFFD